MPIIQLLGSTLGLGLVSGINLYATVLVMGLGIRSGLIVLRPDLQPLEVLANPIVITAAGIIFLVEFLADKIKWIDSLWDAVHTFIRPLGAAVIGATAVGQTGPGPVVVGLLCGGVALSGHSTKAGLRLLVNHSPEPFSNIALSLIEDGAVVLGTYLAIQHPKVMLAVVVLFTIAFLWFAPKVLRLIRIETVAILALIKKMFVTLKVLVFRRRRTVDNRSRTAVDFSGDLKELVSDQMPVDYLYYVKDEFNLDSNHAIIRCVAGKGVRGVRHSIGYLNITRDEAIFVTKRLLQFRNWRVSRNRIDHVHFKRHLLLDRLSLRIDGKQHIFYFFKEVSNRNESIGTALLASPTVKLDS